MRTFFVCLLSSVSCLLVTAPASAQQKDPLPAFVADVHGIFARHKSEPSTATELGVAAGNLPTRSLGLVELLPQRCEHDEPEQRETHENDREEQMRKHTYTIGIHDSPTMAGGGELLFAQSEIATRSVLP